ncbi:MAG: hypothetical protein M1822_009217 [Bathelium mastoideum]|nr:MAG: hypothetical protein M1822_009217 [Bathelium mastoideum]
MSTPSIAFQPAPGPSLLSLWDPDLPPSQQRTLPPPSAPLPRTFLDAMTVRTAVFVTEQSIPLAAEFEPDDARSFHWVAYADNNNNNDSGSTATLATRTVPVAAIRLVPPPHAPDPYTAAPLPQEPFCKIGRLCTVAPFRGRGLGRVLVQALVEWAAGHAGEIGRAGRWGVGEEKGEEWKGLVLAHAQTEVKGWWEKMGFEVDEGMGEWDEEGIAHVGMWKRLEVRG